MDEVVTFLARLDWFERVDALIRRMWGVRSWRLRVPRDCGWSGYQIEQLLRRYGVKVWDRNLSSHHLSFRVRLQQANWAEYVLCRRGIPVCSPPFNPRNQEYRRWHAPGSEPGTRRSPRVERRTWADRLLSLFF